MNGNLKYKLMNVKNILFILLIAILYGCTEEDIVKKSSNLIITGNIHSSRTSYSSENDVTHVSWVEGDAIGLFSKDFVNLKYTALDSSAESIFVGDKFDVNEGDTIYAIYPYNEQINDESPDREEILSGKLPLPDCNWQRTEDGIAQYDYMYAMGIVKNNRVDFQFQHLFAILKITFPVAMLNKNDVISVRSTENISIHAGPAMFDPINGVMTNGLVKEVQCVLNEEDLNKTEATITLGILPQSESAIIDVQNYYQNTFNLNSLYVGKTPKDGMKAGCVYKINLNEERFVSRKEKDLVALKALYKSTNGENWNNHTNWLSDEPLYDWFGLNNGEDLIGESPKFDYASSLRLSDNNLRGTLPKEFVYFMDNVQNIQLDLNGLYGKIPEEVLNHPRWNEIGWRIILQRTWIGGGFDYSEGVNLKTKDGLVPLFVENEQSTVYDILAQNELTYVFNAGAVDMIWGISDERVNKYLDYCNKGFGIVATVGGFGDVPYDDYITFVKERQNNGLPSNILWAKEFGNADSGGYGDMYLFDKEGNLVSYWAADGGISESWYNEKLDSILHVYLGEPEEHPIYTTQYYTSTDYTQDGTAMVLQNATVGKGIDLVFMGDAYVDRDMNEGGKYEKHMKASMEYFFEIEPYKSLRERFNVYAVKVISPNAEFAEGCEHRINYDNNICFEYAAKIPNVDLDRVTIVNVVNNPDPMFVSGYTNMYETGASVAHIERGGPSNIIVHEAGGHGFAKLLDEYIYGGYEGNRIPDNELVTFQNMIKTDYHNRGWGANVDITYDPDKVIWSHFLKDERYKEEVGVYQGAWLYPFDLWRPSENSVMNNDYSRFNAPSREAIYKRIMEVSEGESWIYNYEDFVKYDAINRNAESRSTKISSKERQKIHKDHQSPTFIKGTWRDAMKRKSQIVIPLR